MARPLHQKRRMSAIALSNIMLGVNALQGPATPAIRQAAAGKGQKSEALGARTEATTTDNNPFSADATQPSQSESHEGSVQETKARQRDRTKDAAKKGQTKAAISTPASVSVPATVAAPAVTTENLEQPIPEPDALPGTAEVSPSNQTSVLARTGPRARALERLTYLSEYKNVPGNALQAIGRVVARMTYFQLSGKGGHEPIAADQQAATAEATANSSGEKPSGEATWQDAAAGGAIEGPEQTAQQQPMPLQNQIDLAAEPRDTAEMPNGNFQQASDTAANSGQLVEQDVASQAQPQDKPPTAETTPTQQEPVQQPTVLQQSYELSVSSDSDPEPGLSSVEPSTKDFDAQVDSKVDQTAPTDLVVATVSSESTSAQASESIDPQTEVIEISVPDAARKTQADSPSSTPNPVGGQIENSIRSSIDKGENEVTVTLHPPQLGKVSIKFSEQHGQITGLLECSKAETKLEIEQQLPHIVRNLQASGVTIKRLEIFQSHTQEPANQDARQYYTDTHAQQQQFADERSGGWDYLYNQSAVDFIYGAADEPQEALVTDQAINILI